MEYISLVYSLNLAPSLHADGVQAEKMTTTMLTLAWYELVARRRGRTS